MRNLRLGLMMILAVLAAGTAQADTVDEGDRIDWGSRNDSGDRDDKAHGNHKGGKNDLARVPQTGQELCYDTSGNEIRCRSTGQDGELRFGVPIPTPRYTDKGDGTITDNLTGLIWLKNANCPNVRRDWQTALNDVASLNASGKMNGNDCGDTSGKKGSHRTDWRLPNIRELFSLVDFAFVNPAISNAAGTGQGSGSDPFSNFQISSDYWSSTSYAGGPGNALFVFFGGGGTNAFSKDMFIAHVIAVRGGS